MRVAAITWCCDGSAGGETYDLGREFTAEELEAEIQSVSAAAGVPRSAIKVVVVDGVEES